MYVQGTLPSSGLPGGTLPAGVNNGDILVWDGTAWIPAAYPVIGSGVIVSGGAGAAQAVALATILAGDEVVVMRTINGGAPGIAPLVVITGGVGFTLTFAAGDTSTYQWMVLR